MKDKSTEEIAIYSIHEELIQSASEANLGRELTEKEMKRVPMIFIDSEEFFDAIYGALIDVAERAMDDKGWEEYDKENENIPLREIVW
jgi:hypothetical protein